MFSYWNQNSFLEPKGDKLPKNYCCPSSHMSNTLCNIGIANCVRLTVSQHWFVSVNESPFSALGTGIFSLKMHGKISCVFYKKSWENYWIVGRQSGSRRTHVSSFSKWPGLFLCASLVEGTGFVRIWARLTGRHLWAPHHNTWECHQFIFSGFQKLSTGDSVQIVCKWHHGLRHRFLQKGFCGLVTSVLANFIQSRC